MRGIYTAGVLDVFMEEGIKVDAVAGVSAGAIHGASFVSNQPGRNIRYTLNHCRNWRYMSFRSWLLTGDMVGHKFCYDDIPYRLDPFDFETFAKSETEFFACATELETGKIEFLSGRGDREMLDNIRASASLPVVSKIVTIGNKKYLDGGIADSIPYEAFKKMGYERQIVVLTQPDGYVKQPEKLLKIIRKEYRKYPKFIESCEKRHIVYNETLKTIAEAEENGEIIVIRPSKRIPIKRTEKDLSIVRAQYDLGRQDAMAKLDAVKEYLRMSK